MPTTTKPAFALMLVLASACATPSTIHLKPDSEPRLCAILTTLLDSPQSAGLGLAPRGGPRECFALPTPVLVRLDGVWATWSASSACSNSSFRVVNYDDPAEDVLEVALTAWRTDEVQYFAKVLPLEAVKKDTRGLTFISLCSVSKGVARGSETGWVATPGRFAD